MEKVIRNGKVAVLVSYDFGAGWYTWNKKHPELIFSPKVVEMVESGQRDKITKQWAIENLGYRVCCLGAESLEIEWVEQGQAFNIYEIHGKEQLDILDKNFFIA